MKQRGHQTKTSFSEGVFTISLITFVGEALLIFWLLWRAIKGFPSETELHGGQLTETSLAASGTLSP